MRSLFIALFTALAVSLSAQFYQAGCVTDAEGNPLIGANVLIKDKSSGTVTDFDGCFTLMVPSKDVELKVSYVGFVPARVRVNKESNLVIILEASTAALEEVVVTGYGLSRKADMTGSATTMSSRDVVKRSAPGREEISAFSSFSIGSSPVNGLPAGQLTAGENNDFGKWNLWEDISQEDLAEFRDLWGLYPDHRYAVQLTYPGGRPATNVEVTLQNGSDIEWTSRTDNRGRAELWSGMNDSKAQRSEKLNLFAHHEGKRYPLPAAVEFKDGLNQFELPLACARSAAVDIAFVIDATSSMDDEMRYLNAELTDVIRRVKTALIAADLRTAAVFYRDSTDAYVTRHQNFSSSSDTTVAYCGKQNPAGGGDHPEAVDAALETAVGQLDWRENAVSRLLFLVLDAPPHQDAVSRNRLHKMTIAAAARGIRVVPVVCSGMTKDGEYLLRSIALATNGTYVFLTDDSGIGGSHLAPTTDAYEVEKLNDLLVRVITGFSETSPCDAVPKEQEVSKQLLAGDDLKFKVFPNPTSGPVTLEFPHAQGEVHLFDLTGKLLRRIKISSRKERVNLSGLAGGTYLLRWINGDKEGVKQVILQ